MAMSVPVSMETSVTLGQAFLIMFAFLEKEFEHSPSEEIDALLGTLQLWETEHGNKEPMDNTVFPQWLECAQLVLAAESATDSDQEDAA
jgi:hypothetical protein